MPRFPHFSWYQYIRPRTGSTVLLLHHNINTCSHKKIKGKRLFLLCHRHLRWRRKSVITFWSWSASVEFGTYGRIIFSTDISFRFLVPVTYSQVPVVPRTDRQLQCNLNVSSIRGLRLNLHCHLNTWSTLWCCPVHSTAREHLSPYHTNLQSVNTMSTCCTSCKYKPVF